MAATVHLPIRMAIADCDFIEVGTVEFPHRPGELGFIVDHASLAAALRQAADKLDPGPALDPRPSRAYRRYRRRPLEVEAVQWLGDNLSEVTDLMGGSPTWGKDIHGPFLAIKTLEGTMHALVGDWIVKGVRGEFYPVKPDVFAATYEAAGSPPSRR